MRPKDLQGFGPVGTNGQTTQPNDIVARLREMAFRIDAGCILNHGDILEDAAAELERLQARIDSAPLYFVPTEKPATTAAWVDLINSVKSLKGLRGKRVRLVVDDEINTPEHTQ
jgi:hypothetical protein